jgi:L-ascorbate metabolism protein UlaG (beta-lactamase superfamily)
MFIKWLGHSCFKLTLKDGRTIIIDPYDPKVGHKTVDDEADIVLVSHDHYDHSYTADIQGDYQLIDRAGTYNADGLEIIGIETDHDDRGGAQRGKVVCFVLSAEGVRVMHLSDIGAMPDDSFFKKAGKIDILMIPVGGVFTVDAKGAFGIMERFAPNITIPMHYLTPTLTLKIHGVHDFIKLASKVCDVSRLGESCMEITADTLKKRHRIVVMQPSN